MKLSRSGTFGGRYFYYRLNVFKVCSLSFESIWVIYTFSSKLYILSKSSDVLGKKLFAVFS